ncbi:MAG: hypothetical protein M3460_02795 [Actinomycetota bacterium]|nr:hypothetical protein [Actinomycetota bacterium]
MSKFSRRGRDADDWRTVTGVRTRTWSEDKVPQQARTLIGGVDDEVLGIAVEIHNRVADPRTGQPYAPNNYQQSVVKAFASTWTAAQEDSTAASMALDEAYLDRAGAAARCADEALDLVAEAGTILDQAVEAPSGAQLSRRQVANEHRADAELARRREADGDYRHRQRAISRWVILFGAIVYGLVDLLLLYVPILNLGAIEDRGDLIRWLIAVILSVAQAFFLDLVLREHQEADRDCTDLRNAIRDYNRDVRQGTDVVPPSKADIEFADGRLWRAKFLLVVLAGITGVLAAVRIAILVRETNFSVAEAALFGSALGLVLGLLVVVLGRLVCRGNALGDQLRIGGEIIEDTRRLEQEAIAEVTRARDAATAELDAAKAAKARGDDKRLLVASRYWEGMQLAETWLGVAPPLPRALRSIPVVEEANQRVDAPMDVKPLRLA